MPAIRNKVKFLTIPGYPGQMPKTLPRASTPVVPAANRVAPARAGSARSASARAASARAASAGAEVVPVGALLSRAAALFAAEFDRRVAASDLPDLSLAQCRNVLRHLADGPRWATQIVAHSELSKQAVSQQVRQLERSGHVVVIPDPVDHRARLVALTPDGERALALAHRLFAEIEQDWATRIGPADAVALRRGLTALLGRIPAPNERA